MHESINGLTYEQNGITANLEPKTVEREAHRSMLATAEGISAAQRSSMRKTTACSRLWQRGMARVGLSEAQGPGEASCEMERAEMKRGRRISPMNKTDGDGAERGKRTRRRPALAFKGEGDIMTLAVPSRACHGLACASACAKRREGDRWPPVNSRRDRAAVVGYCSSEPLFFCFLLRHD